MPPSAAPQQIAAGILDERQVATIFGVTTKTLRRWIARGVAPPHYKLGRKRFWRREAIIQHMASHEALSGKIAPPRTRRRTEIMTK